MTGDMLGEAGRPEPFETSNYEVGLKRLSRREQFAAYQRIVRYVNKPQLLRKNSKALEGDDAKEVGLWEIAIPKEGGIRIYYGLRGERLILV